MTLIRDFFRRRRLARHLAEHGWTFDFHGTSVSLPPDTNLAVANALIKGKYEAEEARLIGAHLPAGRPVLELGGSLGVVSGFIRSRLDPGTPHLIVEANPHLVDLCASNAGGAEVLCKAVSYDGPVVRFEIAENPHASMLSTGAEAGIETVEVDTTTLAELWQRMGAPEGFSLVADIEGAEVAMVEKDADTLAHAGTILMELHPHLHPDGDAVVDRMRARLEQLGFTLVENSAAVFLWSRAVTE